MVRTKGLSTSPQERWVREAEYLDSVEYEATQLAPATIERYRLCQHAFHSAEYPFARLKIAYFGFLVRLFSRFVLPRSNYYQAAPRSRRPHDSLGRLDWFLFRHLRLMKLASPAVITAYGMRK